MELLEGIKTRRTFRAFKSTPVSKEIIDSILTAAGKSPSYRNSQPWEVAVVSGDKKEEISKILIDLTKSGVAANRDIPTPQDWTPEIESRIREHGAKRFKAIGLERADKQKREEFHLMNYAGYGAPHILFLFIDSILTSWSIFDMGLFAQTLILSAHSFGIGSCLQAALTDYPDAVRQALGLPKNKLLVLGISMGYPDLEAIINTYQSERVSPDTFVQWYT